MGRENVDSAADLLRDAGRAVGEWQRDRDQRQSPPGTVPEQDTGK